MLRRLAKQLLRFLFLQPLFVSNLLSALLFLFLLKHGLFALLQHILDLSLPLFHLLQLPGFDLSIQLFSEFLLQLSSFLLPADLFLKIQRHFHLHQPVPLILLLFAQRWGVRPAAETERMQPPAS